MGQYHVKCVEMENPAQSRSHSNIRRVGLGGPERYTVEQVAMWIERREHSFYTTNPNGQFPREVEVCPCGQSARKHIRSKPDDRADNNLEAQPECR